VVITTRPFVLESPPGNEPLRSVLHHDDPAGESRGARTDLQAWPGTVDEPVSTVHDQCVAGGSWRERSQFEPWPAPPPKYGPHPTVVAVTRVVKVVLSLAVVAMIVGGIFWLMEDERGRNDFQRQLRDIPVLGSVVPEPSDTLNPIPVPGLKGSGGSSGKDDGGIVYPVR
jgi:hypothetical protein